MQDTKVTQFKRYSQNIFHSFTKKYNLSKTLRFELKPLPETKKFLSKFIESDKQRSKDYQKLKEIVDEYHKEYINWSLSKDYLLDTKQIQRLKELIDKSKGLTRYDEKQKIKKEIKSFQGNLRKQIANAFKDKKNLFEKELLVNLLPEWLDKSPLENSCHKKEIVKKFSKFTTYLKGFHENRKNMYSDKEQATAVSHRIINENLPKFFFNMNVYEKVKKGFPGLEKEMEALKLSLKKEFEHFHVEHIKEFFEIRFFNQCLKQKDIDNYNVIIGGKTTEGGEKIPGINEKINLCRQRNKSDNKKTKSLPFMQSLYKQILSDRESHSFFPESFKSNQDMCKAVQGFWKHISEPMGNKKQSLLKSIEQLFKDTSEEMNQMNQIYFNKNRLGDLSYKLFKDWSVIEKVLKHYSESNFKTKKERGNFLKKDFFHFQELHQALLHYKKEEDSKLLDKIKEENSVLNYFKNIASYFKSTLEEKEKRMFLEKKTVSEIIEVFYKEAESVLSNPPLENRKFNKEETERIKNFLDSVLELFHFIKPLYLQKEKKKLSDLDKDTAFYNEFEPLYEKLSNIISLYNKCRNYIAANKKTKKKIKINFEDSTLLDGWDVNKESDNLTVILRRKEDSKWVYYLGVMNGSHRKIFDYQLNFKDHKNTKTMSRKSKLKDELLASGENEKYYEKLNYKLLPGPDKMLPKVFFSKKNLSRFVPSKDIMRIKEKKTYAKNDGENFNLKDCHSLIDFYKKSINSHYDWRNFNFKFSSTDQYKDISDFYHEVGSQGYKLSFDKIKESYIEEKVKAGELYLFQIYNKDFSKHSKGKPNLHTSYFKLLFEQENLRDTVLKMNGEAEIFYRKNSIEEKITHPKNIPIKNKNPENPKKESRFDYDIIKDRRFTKDKFFFHLPIRLNFKTKGTTPFRFNQDVLKFLKDNKKINIIGIDRGERHLAYYTVINQEGEIQKQGSFNTVTTKYKNKDNEPLKMITNYHKLLESKEKERGDSRKSWDEIENIKELKAGYLSHLVHQISRLMIEYNAVVVLEDLNSRFKRSRMKFEKQVYQKLEKALIDKLNYLVFKDTKNPKEPGGYLSAYQLTAPFESFQKLGKQTGFVFYTPAYYTSKVCPLTGFVNLVYPKYKNTGRSRSFFKEFEKIYFDKSKNYFVFQYQDDKLNPSRKSESNSLWTVCTHGEERYKYDRKSKTHKKMDVTQELKNLFDKHNIDYKGRENLIEDIVRQEQKEFFEKLTRFFSLTLQLRHINPEAKTDEGRDFILSPVPDETGRFFDSRTAKKDEPQDADANGAYHIALKGLKSFQNLSENQGKIKIHSIKNKEWFEFIKARKATLKKKAG